MRKLIFIGFIAVGAAFGMLVAFDGDWGLRIVMMVIGAVAGAAIGGAIARVGTENLAEHPPELDHWYGQGTTPKDLARNYWRDRGHAPFMKPPDAEMEGRVSSHDPF